MRRYGELTVHESVFIMLLVDEQIYFGIVLKFCQGKLTSNELRLTWNEAQISLETNTIMSKYISFRLSFETFSETYPVYPWERKGEEKIQKLEGNGQRENGKKTLCLLTPATCALLTCVLFCLCKGFILILQTYKL